MKIYIAHSSSFNFQSELYEPLERLIGSTYDLILPHGMSMSQFKSKELFQTKGCDAVIADVTLPSIGLGIELGWANVFNIPIICIHKHDSAPAPALSSITTNFIPYKDISDIQIELNAILDEF